jgi:hypothetical protein
VRGESYRKTSWVNLPENIGQYFTIGVKDAKRIKRLKSSEPFTSAGRDKTDKWPQTAEQLQYP